MSLDGEVTIRNATDADSAAIHRVHYASSTGPDTVNRGDAGVREWLDGRRPEHYLAELRDHPHIVAEVAGRVVGYCALNPAKDEITSVFVDPQYTRRGIGTAMVRHIEQLARERGLARVVLQAAGGALRFYRKIGYQYTEPQDGEPSWALMHREL